MWLMAMWRYLRGWVRFEAEGGFPERLLNLAARAGLPLWSTRRKGASLRGCCRARDYRRLRPLLRKTGMRARVRERHGAPFILRRYHARIGVPIGIMAFITVLNLLSQRIWVVEINGLQTVEDRQVREVLDGLGVRIGGDFGTLDLTTLQMRAMRELPDVSWIGVHLEGSIVRVDVQELDKSISPLTPTTPSNIKAAVDGRILSIEVTGGQGMVKPGDAVTAGTLLIGGVVNTTVSTSLQRAAGRVMAETERRFYVEMPLDTWEWRPAGAAIRRPTVQVLGLRVPLFTDGELPGERREEVLYRPLRLNGVALPLDVTVWRYTPLSWQPVSYTPAEAEALAREALAAWEAATLAKAEVGSSDIQVRQEGGAVRLEAVFRCVEDIGVEEAMLVE